MTCSRPLVHDELASMRPWLIRVQASMISKITHHGIPRTRPHHDDEDALSVWQFAKKNATILKKE